MQWSSQADQAAQLEERRKLLQIELRSAKQIQREREKSLIKVCPGDSVGNRSLIDTGARGVEFNSIRSSSWRCERQQPYRRGLHAYVYHTAHVSKANQFPVSFKNLERKLAEDRKHLDLQGKAEPAVSSIPEM